MPLAYLKTVHGVLGCIQIFLLSTALLAGHLLWNRDIHELYWMFFSGSRQLITLVLLILSVLWFIAVAVMVQQLFMRDLLEQMGKAKLLVLHAASLGTVLLAAVIESYYMSKIESGDYYMLRLVFVMVACWLLLVTYIGQFIYVLFQ